MPELIFLLITLALAGSFFALVSWEERRGARVFAASRIQFDEGVARATFIAQHVDWATYAHERLQASGLWLSHEAAHLTLRFVRFIERFLSKTVRQLRSRVAASDVAPGETTRPFVQALSDFKEELKNTRPEELTLPPE